MQLHERFAEVIKFIGEDKQRIASKLEVELPADINTIEELVLNRKGEIRTNTLTILNVLSADFDYLFSAPEQSIEEW